MSTIHTNHPDVKRIARAAYPDYTGRKYRVVVADHPLNVASYWDGGTRSFFAFLRLDNLTTWKMPQQSAFDTPINGANSVKLVPGMVCVEHSFFCGRDMGIRVHVHPDNAPRLLPEPNNVSRDEKIVLVFTRAYKNSYGGRSNVRYHEAAKITGITLERWEAAKTALIAKKLLNRAGSITMDGRNVAGNISPYIV